MQDAARHRQGRQGRAVGHSSAAAWRHRAARVGEAHRHRHRRCRRYHLGHQLAARAAERRSRPDVGAGCRLRFSRQRRHARSLLRLGHHQRQHGRRLDHVGLRGSGDRRRHRDDVDGRPPRRRPVHDGRRQSSPAREASAVAPGRLRRRRRHARGYHTKRRRRARPGESKARGRRHQGRPFRQQSRSGSSRGRQPCARPRGISAAANHARRPCRAETCLYRGRRLSARRQGHHLPQSHSAKIPRSRNRFRPPRRQFIRRRRWLGGDPAGVARLTPRRMA